MCSSDLPLLEGYEYQIIRNKSKRPGNQNFFGYINPDLSPQLAAWRPDAILLMNYAFLTYILLLLDPRFWGSRSFFAATPTTLIVGPV